MAGSAESFPSILVAAQEELRKTLVRSLEAEGYLVFGAGSEAEAFHIVISQSRLIHILLADVNMSGYNLATALKPYRQDMRVLFIAASNKGCFSDALNADAALAKVRELLTLPKWTRGNRRAGEKVLGMTA